MPENNPFLQSLRVVIRPLPGLCGVLFFTHGGALLLILSTGLAAWLQACSIAGVCLHGYRLLHRHILLADPRQPREVLLNARDQWLLTDGRGVTLEAELLSDSLIHPLVMALRFRTDRGVQRVLVLRNDQNADTLRRLRVRLRHRLSN